MVRTLRRGRTALIAVAVLVAVTGGIGAANAAGPVQNQIGNLITPCRLIDTRPAPDKVGPRGTPIGAGETFTTQVTGSNGNCVIPSSAKGIIANVTAVGPTAESFLTVWPADQTRPTASNLNWVGGQRPVPNQVTTPLSATGSVSIYNNSGTVNVIVDIVGYFTTQDLSNYYTKSEVDAAIAAANVGRNRIINPSFESGTTSWGITGDAYATAYGNVSPSVSPPAGAGGNVGVLRAVAPPPPPFPPPPATPGTLTQSVAMSPDCFGSPVTFSAYAAAVQGSGSVKIEFVGTGLQNTQTVPDGVPPFPASMAQYTYNGIVPAGTTSVKVTFTFPDGNFMFVDLVSLRILGC